MSAMRQIPSHVLILSVFICWQGNVFPLPATAKSGHGFCGTPTRICGLNGPEDLVAVGHEASVIASRLGGRGFDVIDTKTRAVSPLDPTALPAVPDPRYPCPTVRQSGPFISHGLSVRRQADGRERLFVVRHGGREAIEIFDFLHAGDVESLEWRGCVYLPEGFAGNAVAGRHDGGFYVSSMTDAGDAKPRIKSTKLYAARPSGEVLEWTPQSGFHTIPIGAMSGPNGIELSSDDRWLYVNGWASREVVRFDLLHPHLPARRLRVSFMPDNLRWAEDGSLIAAGVYSTPRGVLECAGTHADGSPCATRWAAVSIDPRAMKLRSVVRGDKRSGFGDVSVALPVGGALWLGAFDGREIAIEPHDPLARRSR